jgi:hypothetical protein
MYLCKRIISCTTTKLESAVVVEVLQNPIKYSWIGIYRVARICWALKIYRRGHYFHQVQPAHPTRSQPPPLGFCGMLTRTRTDYL